ncbi:MAG: hypothetical protein DCC46_02905 [Armatimonadetes bacterium]|nr:MAG: hypothetical protein DCC46_02905 [Armatimonadota bacterium]
MLRTLALATVLSTFAFAPCLSAAQTQTASGNPANLTKTQGQIPVGPSFEELVAKLKDLRERKKYDLEHGRKHQAYLAEKIEIVKRALRNHHGSRGQKAALNQPIDSNPPK